MCCRLFAGCCPPSGPGPRSTLHGAPAVTWSLVWLESIRDSSTWYLCTCLHRDSHQGGGGSSVLTVGQAPAKPLLISTCHPGLAKEACVVSGLGLFFHLGRK